MFIQANTPIFADQFLAGRGEIGRRTRLRIWRREAWGFESLRPDTQKRASGFFLMLFFNSGQNGGHYGFYAFVFFQQKGEDPQFFRTLGIDGRIVHKKGFFGCKPMAVKHFGIAFLVGLA